MVQKLVSTDRRRNRIEERGMDRKGGWSKGVLPTEETCVRAREAEVAERRRATGVCPMLSVVAMGMLLIGRRADRRHGSRGATPTIARPRTPTSTPPPSPDSPRQRAACNLSLPHVSIPRAFTTRTPRQSLLHAFDRVQTHSTRVHLTTESRLPGELSSLSLSLLPFNAANTVNDRSSCSNRRRNHRVQSLFARE